MNNSAASGGVSNPSRIETGITSYLFFTASICAWRARSTDTARMRAASCGLWNPVEFSDELKSHLGWAYR
jgi:hypothetical protein